MKIKIVNKKVIVENKTEEEEMMVDIIAEKLMKGLTSILVTKHKKENRISGEYYQIVEAIEAVIDYIVEKTVNRECKEIDNFKMENKKKIKSLPRETKEIVAKVIGDYNDKLVNVGLENDVEFSIALLLEFKNKIKKNNYTEFKY